jgi:hypothetical protein
MAIAALKLDVGAVRPAPDRLHVNRVIQLDRRRITRGPARNGAQDGKFRMAISETAYAIREMRLPIDGTEIGVTFGAAAIASGADVHVAAMFAMTRGAWERFGGHCVMHWAVVASEAGTVRCLGGKRASLLDVTGCTFLLENRVRF